MALPHIDPYIAIAGLIVGFLVGMTGMGGGALMTPILVIVFRIHPLAAVSSDLVSSVIMRPFGAVIHARRKTVNWALVKWLALGSVPSAFLGVLILRVFGKQYHLDKFVSVALGVALVVAAAAILLKALLSARQRQPMASAADGKFPINPMLTVGIGVVGGLIVGMTSVGSGSLMIVMLMLLYRWMPARRLVGTDLVQALPLVASAALGHLLFGDFKLAVTAAIVLGSIPGVLLGASLSAYAPNVVVRPVLFVVLLASGLKLFNLPLAEFVLALVAAVGVAFVIWLKVRSLKAARRMRLMQPMPATADTQLV